MTRIQSLIAARA